LRICVICKLPESRMRLQTSVGYKRLTTIVRIAIILVGGAMFVGGNLLPEFHYLHVRWNDLLSHLGAFIAILVSLDWFFNEKIRRELIVDVADQVYGLSNIHKSGISTFEGNSKNVDYLEYFSSPDHLFIGLHYDPRLVFDNIELFKERIRRGFPTTILLLSMSSDAFNYLGAIGENKDIALSSNKLDMQEFAQLKAGDEKGVLKILVHSVVLRYSFVATHNSAWVRFYKNSVGLGSVPALEIRRGGAMFDFVMQDIKALVGHSKEATL
jgi:hypothetical protein